MHDLPNSLAGFTSCRRIGPLLLACAFSLAITAKAGELSPYTEGELAEPAFTLEGLDGKPHRLADYRGKVVLVNFWASWCPPCLAELPGIQRLADRMTGMAFAVLLVNVGESPFRVSKFLKLTGVRLSSLLDDKGETFKAWRGAVYPTSFVLDAQGRVRYVAYGPLEWDSDQIVATLTPLLSLREPAVPE
jgi:thiol-disulfide isomerase/thioredoxin